MGPTGKNFLLTMLNLFAENKKVSVVNNQFGSLTSTFTLLGLLEEVIDIATDTQQEKNDLPKILHWSDYELLVGLISPQKLLS